AAPSYACRPAIEPRLTMWPPSRMCGRQSRVMRTSPFTFVSKTVRSSSSLESSKGARPSARPALLTRMSMPPSCSTAASTNAAALAGSVTSSGSRISVSSRSMRRAPPATRTPASASMRAVDRPKPDDAPVTIAVLPRRSTVLDANRLRALGHVVDLQRRVAEAEALLEQPAEPAPGRVAVAVRRDEDVGGKRGEPARHGPDVEIVHLDHLGVGGESARDRVGVDPGRRGLEEDPARLAQQGPARADHEGRDEERGDGVEPVPAGGENECAGDGGSRERSEVGGDVEEGGADVEARAVGAGEDERGREVDGDPDEGERQDDPAVHGRRRDEPPRGRIDHPRRHQQERDAVALGGEDLGPCEAERPAAAGGAGGERPGDERRRECGRVGQHVSCVRKQGKRVGDDARGDLSPHEGEVQCERVAGPPPVVRAVSVGVHERKLRATFRRIRAYEIDVYTGRPMATADVAGTLRSSEESVALASQLRRLARVATAVAVLTSPAAYFFYRHSDHLSVIWALAATAGTVIGFRGFVDLVIRRLIPWPSLFGTEEKRLREEDIVNRRRAWTWRFWYRIGIAIAVLVTIIFLWQVLLDPTHRTWWHTLTHTLVGIGHLLRNRTLLLQFVLIFFLFFANFFIFMGPMMLMGISQIRGYEPG